jgi:hypothetical protein
MIWGRTFSSEKMKFREGNPPKKIIGLNVLVSSFGVNTFVKFMLFFDGNEKIMTTSM